MFATLAYRRSPRLLQEVMISTRALGRACVREGPAFRKILQEIHATQYMSPAELARYQEKQLDLLLNDALGSVAFYRSYRRIAEWRSGDEGVLARLASFPILDKTAVRNAGSRIIRKSRGLTVRGSTSGTTGAPLTILQNFDAIRRENAFIWRQLQWAGFRAGQRRAWIRGDMIVPIGTSHPPFWRKNWSDRTLMLSSYHLSERSAPAYLSALREFDPHIIQAYPSSASFLARHIANEGLAYGGRSLHAIVTSSESLSIEQKNSIEAAFGVRVFDWYGQFERVAAIGTCEKGSYHVLSDYSYVELVPAGDGRAEIIGTGFNNHVMPLIRYRTGDVVVLAARNQACACGRAFPVVDRVIGRVDDVVRLPDGRHIGRLDHVFKGVSGVLEAQIRQDDVNCVQIIVVAANDDMSGTRSALLKNARERLGDDIAIEVEFVGSIDRPASGGKFKNVICNV